MALVVSGMPFRFILSIILSSDFTRLFMFSIGFLCVVTREGEGIYEIKNIATVPFFQRQGYGKRLIEFLFEYYQGKCLFTAAKE